MFHYEIDNPTYLAMMIESVTEDDLTIPWDKYPCLVWPRGKDKDGYGRSYRKDAKGKKRRVMAHREAFRVVKGEIPKGIQVCHHCDRPSCFRPVHLFAGTQSQNMRDCVAKGRWVCGPLLHPERIPRGMNHSAAKLTDSQVQKIREMYEQTGRSQHEIGKIFGVSQTLIGNITRRVAWKHV